MSDARQGTCAIPVEQLNRRCRVEEFSFRTTAEIAESDTALVQERALSALALGVQITAPDHNVF